MFFNKLIGCYETKQVFPLKNHNRFDVANGFFSVGTHHNFYSRKEYRINGKMKISSFVLNYSHKKLLDESLQLVVNQRKEHTDNVNNKNIDSSHSNFQKIPGG